MGQSPRSQGASQQGHREGLSTGPGAWVSGELSLERMLSGSRSVIGSLSHLVWGCSHTGSAAAIGEEAAAVPPGGRVLAWRFAWRPACLRLCLPRLGSAHRGPGATWSDVGPGAAWSDAGPGGLFLGAGDRPGLSAPMRRRPGSLLSVPGLGASLSDLRSQADQLGDWPVPSAAWPSPSADGPATPLPARSYWKQREGPGRWRFEHGKASCSMQGRLRGCVSVSVCLCHV